MSENGFVDHGLVQVAYRVKNLREAARRFSQMTGAGPFFVIERVAMDAMHHPYRNAPNAVDAVLDHSIALGQWGAVQVELIEYHRLAPAAVAEALDRPGFGPHHVARFVADLDTEGERLRAAGAAQIVEGATPYVRFAFFEQPDGGIVECYQRGEHILGVYAKVREAARDWDGCEPVRDFAGI